MKVSKEIEKAYKIALKARSNSYSPYSRFKVGAALKVKGQDEAIGGCNIENASFGATICAERVALHAAVSRFGAKIKPEYVIVVTGEEEATVPCALCLQSLAEFCGDGMAIYLGNESELLKKYVLKDLLPMPFRSFETDGK